MRRHTFFFVRKRGYTLHIDAPEGGTKMETEKVYAMPFAKIYPIPVSYTHLRRQEKTEAGKMISGDIVFIAGEMKVLIKSRERCV